MKWRVSESTCSGLAPDRASAMMKSFAIPARLIDTIRRSFRIMSSRVAHPPQSSAATRAVPPAICPHEKPAKPRRREGGAAAASVGGTSGSPPMVKASCSVIGHVPLGCCGAREQRSAPRDAEEQHQTAEEIQKDLGEFGAALAVGREIEIGRAACRERGSQDVEIGGVARRL